MVSVLALAAVFLLFLAAFLLFRALLYSSSEEPVEAPAPIDVDSLTVAGHLARIVRCQTVSGMDPDRTDWEEFRGLRHELASMYPRVHRTLAVTPVSHASLLFTWQGSDPELKPVLLAAHQDVVPVEAETQAAWDFPPFSGEIAEGYVWGRGSMDDKSAIIGLMEAAEALIQGGFHPERTIYFALGHDEELAGVDGAGAIARLLMEEGVELEAVIDEGGFLVTGLIPGVDRPLAMVGVAEKAFLNLELTAEGPGGHSSAPVVPTAIGRLSRAIERLESHPMPARLKYAAWLMDAIASELPIGERILFANRWLFGPLLKSRFSEDPTLNAMIRTTTAPTLVQGGVKENILPAEARAVVNFRLLPGDTLQSVIQHATRVLNDEKVRLRVQGLSGRAGGEEMPAEALQKMDAVSDTRGPVYLLLADSIRKVFPEAVVAPYLSYGASDARYYLPVCPQVFRFAPIRFDPGDFSRVHGTNERLAVKNCGDMVLFYRSLMTTLAGKG